MTNQTVVLLSPQEIEFLDRTLSTVSKLGLECVVLDAGRIRATDTNKNMCILHNSDVPPFSFGSIGVGIGRLPSFIDRLRMVKDLPGRKVEVTIETPKDVSGKAMIPFARFVTFKAKGIKVEFRCASPMTVKSPTAFSDEFTISVELPQSFVQYLKRAKDAMQAEICSLVGDDTGVRFEMLDVSGDKMTFDVADKFTQKDNGRTVEKFKFYYTVKHLMTVVSHDVRTVQLSPVAGILKASIDNLDTHLIPRQP